MKILAINSSHRGEHGFTQVLIDRIKMGAVENGAQFETIVLAEHKINQCLGCDICHTYRSYLKCVYEDQDDAKSIFQKMREADLIIYATPVYIFNMSGLLKKFLERFNSIGDIYKLQVSKAGLFFHHIDKAICSKPFVLLTTCGNIEDETSKSLVIYFKTLSKFTDAPMVGKLVRNASFLLENKSIEELPVKQFILDAFQGVGRDLALKGKVSKKQQRMANSDAVKIPLLMNHLMKIRPLKVKLLAEGLKRGDIQFK